MPEAVCPEQIETADTMSMSVSMSRIGWLTSCGCQPQQLYHVLCTAQQTHMCTVYVLLCGAFSAEHLCPFNTPYAHEQLMLRYVEPS